MQNDEQSRNLVVGIGRSVSTFVCMNIRNVTERTSTTVELDFGQVIMPPCVQYFDGECSSVIFTGIMKLLPFTECMQAGMPSLIPQSQWRT